MSGNSNISVTSMLVFTDTSLAERGGSGSLLLLTWPQRTSSVGEGRHWPPYCWALVKIVTFHSPLRLLQQGGNRNFPGGFHQHHVVVKGAPYCLVWVKASAPYSTLSERELGHLLKPAEDGNLGSPFGFCLVGVQP